MKIKKLIVSVLCAAVFLMPCVSAEKNPSFTAYSSGNEIVKIEAKIDDGNGVLTIFDENNVLIGCSMVNIKDGSASTKISYPEDEFSLKLYYDIGSDLSLMINGDEIKQLKEEEETKDETFTAADLDSLFVVTDTGKIYDEENDAVLFSVNGLYRKKEITIKFEENYPIADTSAEFSYMAGQSVENLKKGDILTLHANLSGSLTGVTFMFRPPEKDAVTNSELHHLFVSGGNTVFGLIGDKIDADTFVLYDETGLESEAEYIETTTDTTVYICDMQSAKIKPQIATRIEIVKSEIPGIDFDDNDNIINWTDGCNRNYAYVRLYDGEVCDIVVYENY